MKTRNARTLFGAALIAGFALGAGQAFAADPPTGAKVRGSMGQHDATQHGDATGHASKAPVTDTWITTKVKADLLATKDVPGSDIKVETVDGTVALSGMVETQAQRDKAVSVAGMIHGVRKVDASGLQVGAAAK